LPAVRAARRPRDGRSAFPRPPRAGALRVAAEAGRVRAVCVERRLCRAARARSPELRQPRARAVRGAATGGAVATGIRPALRRGASVTRVTSASSAREGLPTFVSDHMVALLSRFGYAIGAMRVADGVEFTLEHNAGRLVVWLRAADDCSRYYRKTARF